MHRHRQSLAIVLSVGAFLSACTKDGPPGGSVEGVSASGNRPPVVRSVALVPTPVVLLRPVSVRVEADDPDRDPLTFTYQWFANGEPLTGQTSHQLAPELLKRGDRVHVRVIPSDGTSDGKPFVTEPLVVGNTPPVVSQAAFEPNHVIVGERLRVLAEVSDHDRDPIRVRYRWWKNKTLLKEGDENELDTTGLAIKDEIRVEVIPADETSQGLPTVVALVVGNTAPRILSSPSGSINRGRFEYAVRATDPDGDAISFSLEAAPPGMTIDQTNGQILWVIPTGIGGSQKVRVVAEDGQGGVSFQEFELTLPSPAPVSKPIES